MRRDLLEARSAPLENAEEFPFLHVAVGRPDFTAVVAEHVERGGRAVVSAGRAAFVDVVAQANAADRLPHTQLSHDIAKI